MKALIWILALTITSGLAVPFSLSRAQAAGKSQSSNEAPGISPKASPSSHEIADAKSKGLVWVNLATHVYHKDGRSYGTTKRGKFMTEDDAKKAGFRIASEPESRKQANK